MPKEGYVNLRWGEEDQEALRVIAGIRWPDLDVDGRGGITEGVVRLVHEERAKAEIRCPVHWTPLTRTTRYTWVCPLCQEEAEKKEAATQK